MLISKPVTHDKAHLDSLARIDDYGGQKKGADPLDRHRGGTLWYGVCGLLSIRFHWEGY